MGLTLTTLRCPDAATPESRHAAGGELSIGRGPDNDWVLPDPDRHLSKRHCVLAFRSGQWQLTDLSSNGTFLNRDAKPVGGATARPVRSGDRLRLGSYEIELTIRDENEPHAVRPAAIVAQPRAPTPSMVNPFADEPAPASFGWGDADPLLPDDLGMVGSQSSRLPPDFDPIGDDRDGLGRPTLSDHSPAIDDAFRPPPATASVIPDDWDLSAPGFSGSRPLATALPPVAPAALPAPLPVRLPPVLPDAGLSAPLRPGPPPPPAPAAELALPLPAAADAELLAAFLRGTGLADAVPPDPARTMEAVGAALRAAVVGIRATLIARATVKGEFRIEQTMVRASGNNPLKFSAGDDDAMAALLGIGRRNAMAADQAVAEALRDIRLHELATMAAMQSAVRALLAQFDPGGIERGVESGALAILPGQRKARLWDAFVAMHAKVSQALSDDFDSVFGKAFARAYEQTMRDAGAGEDHR